MKTLLASLILFSNLALFAAAPPAPATAVTGKVIETIESGGYTYLLVQQVDQKTWIATKPVKVTTGDTVRVTDGQLMKDFPSKTLNRTFDWILFTSAVEINGQAANPSAALPPGHPALPGAAPAAAPHAERSAGLEVKPGTVEKLPGGYTVAQCYAEKKKLQGQTIQIRGVVVKFNAEIMGKNWIHLRDGTGTAEANDLTLTTTATVKPGDTVVAKGRLVCDKDFGYGYKYAVLLEDAEITKP